MDYSEGKPTPQDRLVLYSRTRQSKVISVPPPANSNSGFKLEIWIWQIALYTTKKVTFHVIYIRRLYQKTTWY